MKAAERAVVVKVLAKTVRKVRDEYEQKLSAVHSEMQEMRQAFADFRSEMEAANAAVLEQVNGIPAPKDGEDATPEAIRAQVDSYFEDNPVRVPEDGKSVTVEDVLPKIQEEARAFLAKLFDELPKPKDGESVTLDDVRPLLEAKHAEWALDWERHAQGLIQSATSAMRQPEDGKDADPNEVAKRVIEQLGLSGDGRWDVENLCRELVLEQFARVDLPEAEKPTDEQVNRAVRDYFREHPVKDGEDGADGKSVSADEVMPAIMEHVQKVLDAIPVPRDGQDATDEQVSKAVAGYFADNPIPIPKDGTSVTVQDVMPELRAELMKAVSEIPEPKDGKDGTSVKVEDVMPALTERVDKFLSEIPVPKDGESVTVDDVLPDVLKALKSMESEWALDFEKRAQSRLDKAIESIPKPKDGKDAFQLEDIGLELGEDGRTLTLFWQRGEDRIERSIKGEWPIYREVWNKELFYDKGDCVTYDGSTWMAVKQSKGSKPGQFNSAWKLAVKKGRNGKS